MTRPCITQIHCPNCRARISFETSFGRWIRDNKELESKLGFCLIDQDYWVHKFKTFQGREFQLIMAVEIKTMGAELTDAQRDTLHCVNQIMRNRKRTPTKERKWQIEESVVRRAYSVMLKRETNLRVFGMHVLTFSALGPEDSEWIRWDSSLINIDTLTQILRFDIDPDTLKVLDLRNHHITKNSRQLRIDGKAANAS